MRAVKKGGITKTLNEVLTEYGRQIDALANSPRYQSAVQSLTCYKGIKNVFALTMITEIGDIKRFSHPRKLVSWTGMDIREYSSGGKYNRFGITKHGNRYVRFFRNNSNPLPFDTMPSVIDWRTLLTEL